MARERAFTIGFLNRGSQVQILSGVFEKPGFYHVKQANSKSAKIHLHEILHLSKWAKGVFMDLSPECWLKREMVLAGFAEGFDVRPLTTNLEVNEAYGELGEFDDCVLDEIKYDMRQSGIDTGIHCGRDRNYSSKSVAKKMTDGPWIGWTYWFGGGKHGEPDAVEWLEESYFVKVEDAPDWKAICFVADGKISGKPVAVESSFSY